MFENEQQERDQRRADYEALVEQSRKFGEQERAFKEAALDTAEKRAAIASTETVLGDPAEALPLSIPADVGLQFVPEDLRACYRRRMDGSFELRYVITSDAASMKAHHEKILAGELKMYSPDNTPELQRLKDENGKARAKMVLEMLEKQNARSREAEREADRKRLQEEHERLEDARWRSRAV